jgi:membrane associated rhomboid family serine protease
MVMGCLGLLAIQSVFIWRKTPHAERLFLAGLFAGLMLFVLLGLTPGTDVVAHFGGFSCGLVLGVILSTARKAILKPLANLLASLIFLILVLWPWWLALTHPRR